MGLGSFEGASWLTVAPLDCPNQMAIVALGGLEVCDGGHWVVVMKERALESGAHAHTFRKRRECVGHPAAKRGTRTRK